MSHIAKIKVEIKNLASLKAACNRLGLTFVEGQRGYRWYGRWVGDTPMPAGVRVSDLGKCDHAIRVPGAAYEVGVVTTQDGKYTLMWDFYGPGGLAKVIGNNGERLVQAYAVEAAKAEAINQGYSVYEEPLQDGSIRLHVQAGG